MFSWLPAEETDDSDIDDDVAVIAVSIRAQLRLN